MQPPTRTALAPRTIDVTYPGRADQIRLVRADLRTVLVGCPLADDVILCASELAANAVLHSRSRLRGRTFAVKVSVSERGIRIAVEDNGGRWVGGASRVEVGQHGLDIVRALASDWGIDGDDAHRIVWAVLDWPQAEAMVR
jgi:serine/threonine-protein kinase RsbW